MAIEAVARGYKTQCLMDWEASFGEPKSAAGGAILPVNSFGLNVSRALNSAQTLTGRRDPVTPFDGNVEITGDIVVPVDTRAFGWWLKLLLGSPTTTSKTVNSKAVYTHVYKPSDNCPSAVIQSRYGTTATHYGKFTGCKATSMRITTGGDDELTATFSIAGQDVAYSTSNYNTGAELVALNRLNNFQASLTRGEALLATCTQFDFTIDNGMDTSIRTLGSKGKLYDIVEGIMSITGTATMLFTNLTTLNAAQNSTEIAFTIQWAISDTAKLSFNFPEVRLQFQGPTVDGPTGILTEFPFIAYFNDDAKDTSCVATLVNDVRSYA